MTVMEMVIDAKNGEKYGMGHMCMQDAICTLIIYQKLGHVGVVP